MSIEFNKIQQVSKFILSFYSDDVFLPTNKFSAFFLLIKKEFPSFSSAKKYPVCISRCRKIYRSKFYYNCF